MGAPLARLRPHAPAVDPAHQREQRRCGDRDEREHRVEPQQHREHPGREQRRLGDLPERLREQVAHRVDVAGHVRQQVALLAALVEAEREPLEVVVDARAQLVRDPLARDLEPQVRDVLRARLDERDDEHQRRHGDQQADVGARRA